MRSRRRTPASARTHFKKKIYKNNFFILSIFFASSVRTHGRVRADAPCFIPGNFKKNATVRPSHGRPRGHRPIVRPSIRSSVRPSKNVRVTTMAYPLLENFLFFIFGK
jgi:hypothetical protein